ncbi:MAG: Uma2 family endonuclease [Gemmatimonas sp.]
MSTASRDRRWTLEELHALPDDRNKYELIDGELFVTPAPTDEHERILSRLHEILVSYVSAEGLGRIYRPRSVFRIGRRVEVEPDLMVRQDNQDPEGAWDRAPLPSLVVEALSKRTRTHDLTRKRALYLMAGIAEYWVVDGKDRTFTVFVADSEPLVVSDELTWAPVGASEALTFSVSEVFA